MGKRDELHAKHERLRQIVKDTGGMVVAFSGGVDSTYLLKVASDVLGPGVLAVSAMAAAFPRRELDEAEQFCAVQGVGQVVFPFCELAVQGFCDNPPDRCYLCKKALFSEIWEVARSHGFSVVADGSNLDDEGDYRPGMRALAELGVRSPLREAALTKADIRELSRELGLPTWSKPSFACLATRIPYGEQITEERLSMVGRAEQYLIDRGFAQVRVRLHGGALGRIEVLPEDFGRAVSLHDEIAAAMGEFGFLYSALDLTGYRTGSMNRAL